MTIRRLHGVTLRIQTCWKPFSKLVLKMILTWSGSTFHMNISMCCIAGFGSLILIMTFSLIKKTFQGMKGMPCLEKQLIVYLNKYLGSLKVLLKTK